MSDTPKYREGDRLTGQPYTAGGLTIIPSKERGALLSSRDAAIACEAYAAGQADKEREIDQILSGGWFTKFKPLPRSGYYVTRGKNEHAPLAGADGDTPLAALLRANLALLAAAKQLLGEDTTR